MTLTEVELGAGVARCNVGEFGAERGEGFASSGRAGGVKSDVQGAFIDLQVARQREGFRQERAGFVVAAAVVLAPALQ